MNQTRQMAFVLAMTGLLGAGIAQADYVDFSNPLWGNPAGATGTSLDGATATRNLGGNIGSVTITASNTVGGTSNLYWQAFDGNPPPLPSYLYSGQQSDGYDGVGVTTTTKDNNSADEVTMSSEESVTLVFDGGPKLVAGVGALDLFTNTAEGFGPENMKIEFFNGVSSVFTTTLTATETLGSTRTGFVNASFAAISADKIVFTMTGTTSDDGVLDGAPLYVQVVPIPAAAWLFGSALVGMVGMGRRKSNKA